MPQSALAYASREPREGQSFGHGQLEGKIPWLQVAVTRKDIGPGLDHASFFQEDG